ncbi:MAG: class and aminotransferase protein [Naasia sp.]|jgi:cystathionine beta-lyase|uniref:MalY/PatB family protein n=1 Tax=Naasia sp. TaxID=2546198 RepID=UPI0026358076|nr:aminotransferase class I/II-fold pyridoxal phosphate-dependent enzyme [Naasia sp.]MCU1571707.1 class and aminotransferase protein [Naasia sp.]
MDRHGFDGIDLASLRAVGGLKWSMFPGRIGAFVAEMDFGVAPAIADALHGAVDRGLFGYLPPAVSRELSDATSAWQRDAYGWDVPAERVHPVADVLAGLVAAIERYSPAGSPVILPTPSYMPFLRVPGTLGRSILEVPMSAEAGHYGLDLAGLERAFQAGGHLLILCNPYNPVGRVFSRKELVAISEVVSRNGGRVFADEIHSPMVYAPSVHIPYASISPEAAAHTLTATSASKAWNLPGLKCAQVILTSDADAEVWEQFGYSYEHGASNLGVIANTAAYTDGRGWLDEVREYNDGNRIALAELLAEHLPEVRYTPPEGTYIGWLDARALGVGDSPAEFFRDEAGVAMTDGAACGAPGVGFLRLIFATPRPILEQAVAQMGAALDRRSAATG